MFSLYLTIMNICIENFDISNLNPSIIKTMDYLNDYLEQKWDIQKKDNRYILKKNGNKIFILSKYINCKTDYDDICDKNKYVYCFLFNTLNNGWKIKKKKDEYIFIKNHEGKKEIFSNNYINTFLKDNFNFN
jgi:hypothetical protein